VNRRLAAILAVVFTAMAVLAPFAAAQEEGTDVSSTAVEFLQIQKVDSSDADAVELLVAWSGGASALQSATITENGQELRPSSVRPVEGSDSVMVLAVDTGEAMLPGDALTRTKRALQDLVIDRPAGQRVGIVSFGGGRARVVQRPTSDTERLLTAIDGLAGTGGSATWAGIHSAARMLQSTDANVGHVVVVAAGPSVGDVGGTRARGAITSAGAATWVVALERGVNTTFLRSIVDASGGMYIPSVNVEAIGDHLADIGARIEQQYLVTYRSPASGAADLTLQVGGSSTAMSYVSGSITAGATALRPVESTAPGGVAFLRDNGFVVGLLLAMLAAVLAAFAVGSLIAPDRSSLDSALEVYTDGTGIGGLDDDDGSGLARTAFIQRAVGLTQTFAERRGFLAKAESTLERADLPLRAAEALFFYAVGTVLVLVLAFVLTEGNILGTLLASAIIAALPVATVNFLARRRQKKFESLLPDTLQLLAGTLRAGYSLMQGVEAVSREVAEPMGKELRRVVTEARLGRPLEESLDASATRMESADFAWAVMAIRIQREVGGNLAELLVTVADTMVERERLRRDVNSLTAEGRVSAMVLGLLPVGLGVVLYMGNPAYMGVLFEERIGQFMLMGSVILAGIGFYWMKKVIEVDI
jgi:tight adherence protein B